MLETRALRLSYDRTRHAPPIVAELDLMLPAGAVTAVVGPNGCGKSTLLRGLARLLRPASGAVLLDGTDLHRLPSREVARRLGLLPQQPVAPEGITVEALVKLGRHPHQGLFGAWTAADQDAVERALARTGTLDLRDRPVDRLSGGQRQRAWIALTLAQETELLLLDEPTTFLDLRHQLDVLDLVVRLQRESARTVVMVLHDLGQAARYADHLVVLRDGRLVAAGPPREILDAELVAEVFEVECRVVPDPETGTPLVVPTARHGSAAATPSPATPPPDAPAPDTPLPVTPSPSAAP